MRKRELERLVEHLAEQPGVRVRRAGGNGYFFYLPDGTCTALHQTASDHRAMRNFRSIITNAGVEWPGENRGRS